MSKILNDIQSTKMPLSICYNLNNIRFVVLYASQKVRTKDELEKIHDVICIENESKTVLAGDFNLHFIMKERDQL